MTAARISAGVPTGGQFAATGHAESGITLSPPTTLAPRVPTDREMLDSIALMMASTPDWDADLTSDIADEIARSGRPHPGEPLLTDSEVAFLEDRGDDDLNEATARRYEDKMYAQRAETANAPMRVDPTDTMALLKAHTARVDEATRAMEFTAAKALAQMAKQEWPNAAYLKFDASENNDRLVPIAVLDEDFNEISTDLHTPLVTSGRDFHGVTDHLTAEGYWTGYREYAPEDEDEWEPCLGLNEIATLDLASIGAGAAPPVPNDGETLYTGAERKVSGHFGNAVFSPRDGEPGTIIMIDTSEGRASEPVVVMVNDQIIDVAE